MVVFQAPKFELSVRIEVVPQSMALGPIFVGNLCVTRERVGRTGWRCLHRFFWSNFAYGQNTFAKIFETSKFGKIPSL